MSCRPSRVTAPLPRRRRRRREPGRQEVESLSLPDVNRYERRMSGRSSLGREGRLKGRNRISSMFLLYATECCFPRRSEQTGLPSTFSRVSVDSSANKSKVPTEVRNLSLLDPVSGPQSSKYVWSPLTGIHQETRKSPELPVSPPRGPLLFANRVSWVLRFNPGGRERDRGTVPFSTGT